MKLSWNEIRARANHFSKEWKGAKYEKGETQTFYNEFFEVFGVKRRRVASFEEPVKLLGDKRGFIDLFWKSTLLVEQKSAGRDLKPAKQQALDYFPGLKDYELPRYILLSDFQTFELYDLDTGDKTAFTLDHLSLHVENFAFIIGRQKQEFQEQDPVNIRASELMALVHDALRASGYSGHQLELMLVRLVFCLFADDTGIFEQRDQFNDYIDQRTSKDGSDLGPRLERLFQVLNTPPDRRTKNLDEDLAAFPYINGDLFAERLDIADFDGRMRERLLAACGFDWSQISPAIFGSLFQHVMTEEDKDKRRKIGAHYTTEANILKIVRPLFMDSLRAEFDKARGNKARLTRLHDKLAGLRFLDPACGCGNFLIIAYRELRRLETELLLELHKDELRGLQTSFNVAELSRIDVDAFYGIEIEEFPARVAEVALWLTDHLMNRELSEAFGQYFARIPLKKSPHIFHGNALRTDWNKVLPAGQCSYVLGNPPFRGHNERDAGQKKDMDLVWGKAGRFGRLDYVTAWYKRAVEYIAAKPAIGVGFVSTNSITQGEQATILWPWMFGKGITVNFAHRTFQWASDAKGKAAVHCVIIGFGLFAAPEKWLFDYDTPKSDPHVAKVSQINGYLVDAPHPAIESRSKTPKGLPRLLQGSKPWDGGHLILTDLEKDQLLKVEPGAAPWLRQFVGSQELINADIRWCLWLKGIAPMELSKLPHIKQRVTEVACVRLESKTSATREYANRPTLFTQDRQPEVDYLAVPETSSERRKYIPMSFLAASVIASNSLLTCSGATTFHLGVLTSLMHSAWAKSVAGRLKSDLRYSPSVYNNFPWPEPTPRQREAIEAAAQAVLDARAEYEGSSLAALYDPVTMPPKLAKAHAVLDKAVDKAFRPEPFESERARLEYLFRLLEQRRTPLLPAKPKRSRKQG